MTTLSPQGFPDISAPLVDSDGRLTPVWAIFLQSVFLRTGGPPGGDLATVTATLAGVPAQMLLLADDDGATARLAARLKADEAAAAMSDDDTAVVALALALRNNAALLAMSDAPLNVREVAGAAPKASPTFTGTVTSKGPINAASNILLTTNGSPLQFTDAAGGNPRFVAQSDNNFVFYGTNGSGGGVPVWSVFMQTPSPVVSFNFTPIVGTLAAGSGNTQAASTAYAENAGALAALLFSDG